jgi:hypothetical protein
MFEKSPRETKPTDNSDLLDVMLSSERSQEEAKEIQLFDSAEKNQPEVVNTVEKISAIISPYFIVIVGLALYDNNFLIGSILIIVGILSLLKVTWQDIINAVDYIIALFSSSESK